MQLPASCIGHPLGKGIGSCPNEGTVTLTTILAGAEGEPIPVIVTVCPSHTRAARHWLEAQGIGDPVDTWSTRTFAEHVGIVEEAGLDWHVLRSA